MQFYARDIMSTELVTVRPEMNCEDLVDLFTAHQISGAPVVNGDGILVGVISLVDVLKNGGLNLWTAGYAGYFDDARLEQTLAEEGFQVESVGTGFVSDCMSRQVHTANPDTTVEELARLMYDNRIHRLIIVPPEADRPVGIVSTFDLLKLMAAREANASPVRR